MKKEVIIDRLGRADLSAVRKQDHVKYLAEESPDGTIILIPLVSARVPLVPLPEEDNELARR
jgi:hypothetical protein